MLVLSELGLLIKAIATLRILEEMLPFMGTLVPWAIQAVGEILGTQQLWGFSPVLLEQT